ncbi:Crp/Fnr family transcriptional regulator [Sphingomonas sp.]|jgi:CRP-like cAMP-binding protein|uniref:Crp/Fnr family transcriptional regulator n=1 Tax=Sphingomonas sp. TaxID=28214 RepID=UPI002ED9B847
MKLEQFTRFEGSERMRLDELLEHPSTIFPRGKTIIGVGDKVDNIHLITKGLATRSKTLRDGSRQLMAFLVPGDLCDVEVFILEAMDHDVVALAETTCVLIPASEMEKLLTESSNLTRAMWWSTMTDSAVLREWIVNHGIRDALQRMAHIFCELLIRHRIVGQGGDNIVPFPLTQEELAEATGMTPVHANRMIQQLRSDGLIELNNKVLVVLDFKRLSELGQYDASYLHLVRTERADPSIRDRVGDLVPPSPSGILQGAWEAVKHPFGKSAD